MAAGLPLRTQLVPSRARIYVRPPAKTLKSGATARINVFQNPAPGPLVPTSPRSRFGSSSFDRTSTTVPSVSLHSLPAMSVAAGSLVAVPAMLMPADAALVLLTARELQPKRLDLAEPTAEKAGQVADYAHLMLPQYKAAYLCKLFYRAPLLATRVRLELARRDREQKVALWRQHAKENRAAAVKRQREAEAATRAERGESLRPRVAAAAGQASGSGTSAAASAAGCRSPDRNVASSSGLAAPAPGLPRTGAGAAPNLVPGAAAANAVGAGPAADSDEEAAAVAAVYKELFGSGSESDNIWD